MSKNTCNENIPSFFPRPNVREPLEVWIWMPPLIVPFIKVSNTEKILHQHEVNRNHKPFNTLTHDSFQFFVPCVSWMYSNMNHNVAGQWYWQNWDYKSTSYGTAMSHVLGCHPHWQSLDECITHSVERTWCLKTLLHLDTSTVQPLFYPRTLVYTKKPSANTNKLKNNMGLKWGYWMLSDITWSIYLLIWCKMESLSY